MAVVKTKRGRPGVWWGSKMGTLNIVMKIHDNANFIDIEKSGRLLSLLNAQGFNLSPRNFPVVTKNHVVQWEVVKRGVAICGMLEEIGDHEPLVERIVIPDLVSMTATVWIVTHKELKTNRRVRMVFDFLVSEFANYQHK